jgi:hypothetical protein
VTLQNGGKQEVRKEYNFLRSAKTYLWQIERCLHKKNICLLVRGQVVELAAAVAADAVVDGSTDPADADDGADTYAVAAGHSPVHSTDCNSHNPAVDASMPAAACGWNSGGHSGRPGYNRRPSLASRPRRRSQNSPHRRRCCRRRWAKSPVCHPHRRQDGAWVPAQLTQLWSRRRRRAKVTQGW